MSRYIKKLAAAAVVGLTALGVQAAPDTKPVYFAANCANCHGTNGQAQPGMESLAGASEQDIVKKMQDFKAGRKPATLMHQLAKGYSDEQIKAIAAYFAAQKK